jgi:hypothetical protein
MGGCTAWLRTLVDCILFRFHQKLGYPFREGETGWCWPACAPLVGWVVLVAALVRMVRGVVLRFMGVKSTGGKDVELAGGEEGVSLVRAIDGEGVVDVDMRAEVPPAYTTLQPLQVVREHDNRWRDAEGPGQCGDGSEIVSN